VMLAEGKVRLALTENAESEAVFLKPGEVATMTDKRLSKRVAKEQQFTSWLQNKLFFENTPLSEVALLLKETYGLQVKFKNPELAKRELSGEISSATGEDILLAIAETFRLKIEKEGQSVLFSETEK
jgi:transmembrane sensor